MAQNPAIIEVAENPEEIKKKIKALPLKEKLKAVALNYYLQQKKKLDIELEKEMKKLQIQFDEKAAKIYKASNEIIEGTRLLTEEELKDVDFYLEGEEATQKNQALTAEPINGYWFKALKNSDIIAQEIKDRDDPILKSLTKIEYEPQEKSDNFSLNFYFAPNDYFKNTVLKKKFILKDGENPVKSEGTIIEWNDGKNVTRKLIKKKQLEKKSGIVKTISQEVDAESFFIFFKPINLEDKEQIEKWVQENKLDKYAERMDIDYDIARMIIDEIIPYSLEYYLGVKINDAFDDIEEVDAESSKGSDEEEENK
ncbi:unnamed protein product [Paramecium sonneborni]|uniref:Nucleosome assembly protein n=1 Tax=Paramecium sonneborni TaxID=65129 RepID=A0A8S1PZK7_9CILI|nr:unnamed protein product [Paramecium sonneborni]CAD8108837.1 unnamed protein product [Paramecium sonneborni]